MRTFKKPIYGFIAFLIISLTLICFMNVGGVMAQNENVVDTNNVLYNDEEVDISTSNNTFVLKFLQNKVSIYLALPIFNDYKVGDDISLRFNLGLDGVLSTYNNLRLYTWGETLIDYGFENGMENKIVFDTIIMEKSNKKVVCLIFENAINKTVKLSRFSIKGKAFSTEGLLGGVQLWQYEPNSSDKTMQMGYVLITPENQIVVIDGGYLGDGAELLKLIHQYGNVVDGWFLTHPHNDHYTALKEILENGDILIKNLYFDFSSDLPNFNEDKRFCIAFEKTLSENSDKINNIVTIKKGDAFNYGSLTIKVLNSADRETKINALNNMSVVFKAETPGEDILFLGDLGESGDVYLNDPYFVREMRTCRVVQMAHHGQNGVSDKFYRQIDEILVCLYPAPLWLYDVIDGAQNGVLLGNQLGSGPWATLHTRSLMRSLEVRKSYNSSQRVHIK